jgi:DHA1 family bicyclomycin/chloramphenicol resistance-like MFS transporter
MSAPPKDAAIALPERRWSTSALMALLAAITALAPFSLQIFLPALPAIQASFAVAPGIVQLALSLSILANAVANLAYGPISDRFGRRPVLLVGLAAFVAGSLGCALASSIELLIVARIVQSIGGAAGMVLARAIVRDLYDRERSASIIAYLTMAMVVAPMLAPTIGAVLIDVASWRAIFYLVTGIGAVLAWPIVVTLAETRPPEARRLGGPFAGAAALLRSGLFWSYVLQSTFGICVFFAFIAGAPYFMIDVLGRSATEYGLWFILVSAAFMAGNLVAGRFSGRIGLDRMVLTGSLLAVAGAGLALLLLLGGAWTPLALFGPMMAVGLGNGFSVPNAQAGAVSVNALLAGTASGIAGFSQMFVAALVSQAVGMLQNGTPYPMAGFMAACAVLSFLGFVVPRRFADENSQSGR